MKTKEELVDSIIARLIRLGYINVQKLETIKNSNSACIQGKQDNYQAPASPPAKAE